MGFKTFGIIGFGAFGKFMAEALSHHGEILVYTRRPNTVTIGRSVDLAAVCAADAVIIAAPFGQFEALLRQIQPQLAPDTVVMDVLSTKSIPTRQLATILTDHPNLLATHPLFGPPSAKHIEPGFRLAVTLQKGERATALVDFFGRQFGLEILRIDADEHDRAMAYMQALPFFIARSLINSGLLDPAHPELAIPSFVKLAQVARIEEHHSQAMFATTQDSNPYAAEARQTFLQAANQLDDQLRQHPQK